MKEIEKDSKQMTERLFLSVIPISKNDIHCIRRRGYVPLPYF